MLARRASVFSSVDPWSRNLRFSQSPLASSRRLMSPRLYDARAKSIALEPSMRVLSRSKNAAAFGM
jgi:hypothetical protein